MIEVSSGASSTIRSRTAVSSSSRSTRSEACGGGAGRFDARGRRHRLQKRDADHPAGQFGGAPPDGDRGTADGELAGLGRLVPLGVAEIVQPIDELTLGERLTAPQFERAGEDARQHALALAVQPLIDGAARTRRSSS